ncbi:MAG: hypothetical protein JW846_07825 [Dehalococcoidia bacterium]|nr:hypothetical protein [Dehalococcoidia bacterium]
MNDEIGYLSHAALLAGYPIDGASSYHAGYSLLLAPLFRLSPDPVATWQGVMVLNAMMWSASSVLLFRVLDRLFAHRPLPHRCAAVAIAMLYPTWLAMCGYAFATTAIVLVFMAAVLAAMHVDVRRKPWSVVPHSLAVGLLYWVHPTGLAVVVASTLGLAVLCARRRHLGPLALHMLVVLLLIFVYREGVHQWLLDVGTAPGFPTQEHYASYVEMLSHLTRGEFWFETLAGALGQMASLVVGSLGLLVVGILEAARRTKESLSGDRSSTTEQSEAKGFLCLFVVLALVAVILLGSASFSAGGRTRIDHWIYARYAEGVLLPLLAIGCFGVFRRRLALVTTGALVIGGVVLVAVADPGFSNKVVNTISFWPQYLVPVANYLIWMTIGGIGTFLFLVAGGQRGIGRCAAIALLFCMSVLSTLNAIDSHESLFEGYSQPTGLLEIVRTNYERGSCVGFNPDLPEHGGLFHQHRFNLYLFYLHDYAYRRMQVDDWVQNCAGPLLTYDIDQLRDAPGVVLLGQEVWSGLYLMAKERDQGFLMPYEAPTERTFLPPAECSLGQGLYRYGEQLAALPSEPGAYHDGSVVSTGHSGFLVFGPYVPLNAGEYMLVVKGTARSVPSGWVDVVSSLGQVQHARFALSSTKEGETGILTSGRVSLDEDVLDLEVRVYVEADDEILLGGYELVPADVAVSTSQGS